MSLMMLGVLLVLQAHADFSLQPRAARSASASIEGIVVRVGSGEPLARAQVTLIGIGTLDDQLSPSPAPPAVMTGPDGRFVFRNVAPGSYRIAVARNGYARQEYGQRVFGGRGTVVRLAGGQLMREIAFHLMPTGAVTGVVTDSTGEPLAGAQVQLLRLSYNASGQRTVQAAGGDRSNDRGEYRVYWITPGRYYVAVSGAAPGRQVAAPGGVGSVNEIVDRRYPTSFYPGTTDVEQAAFIDVAPGAEVTNVDVMMPEQELFRVRGRILDPSTGRHPAATSVSVVSRGASAAPLGTFGPTQSYNPADGTFDLRDVAPGSYWIRAIVGAGSADLILTPGAAGRSVADVFVDSLFAGRQVAQAPLEVFGDIDGLVLALGSGVPIRGVVSVDGQPLSAVPGFERVDVTLRPAARGMLTNPSRHEPLRPDGAFTLLNVLPGEYTVTVQGLPPGYYLKEAQVGNVDALDRPLLISGPNAGTLNVAVGAKGGRVDGVVVSENGQPQSGMEVVLVPERRPARLDRYQTTITDRSGRFTVRGIAPGNYRLFAWEAIEAFAYFDEHVLRQSERHGTAIRIDESSLEYVAVTMIPARVQ